jgi:glutathione dehydrogenase/transferase
VGSKLLHNFFTRTYTRILDIKKCSGPIPFYQQFSKAVINYEKMQPYQLKPSPAEMQAPIIPNTTPTQQQQRGGPAYEVYVMGHSIKDGNQEGFQGQLGACPYSLRVLLLLEERELPYVVKFINLDNKPSWLLKVNPPTGSVPVVKDLSSGAYIVDSDTINDYLEEKIAQDESITEDVKKQMLLGHMSDVAMPAADINGCFFDYLMTTPRGGGEREEERLKEQLQQLEDTVSNEKPYIGGKHPNAADFALAPRVYFAKVGCKEVKEGGGDVVEELFPNVKSWLHRMCGRKSWRNAASFDTESIIGDMKHKMEKVGKKKQEV